MLYTVRALPADTGLFLRPDREFTVVPPPWNALDELSIDRYPWDTTHYRPESHARLGWTPAGLHVLMYSLEPVVRAQEKSIGGAVYKDSCLELYLGAADQPVYFNFECNPIGVMHIGVGTERAGRRVLSAYPAGMRVETSLHKGAWWAVEYVVPAAFLRDEGGILLRDGARLKGNAYKCGDESVYKHHGMWSPVDWPKPDFHRPEFFGELALRS